MTAFETLVEFTEKNDLSFTIRRVRQSHTQVFRKKNGLPPRVWEVNILASRYKKIVHDDLAEAIKQAIMLHMPKSAE